MTEKPERKTTAPTLAVERIKSLTPSDLNDLCDATDAAIKGGGGFGWVSLPARDILERYWQGVLVMPSRDLFVARLDGVICGTCQIVKPPVNNEAQRFAVQLTTNFVAPWARGYGLAKRLIEISENTARADGFGVINLDVRETMEAAIALYDSMGFERIGTHPYYAKVDGRLLKGYYYTKLIEPNLLIS